MQNGGEKKETNKCWNNKNLLHPGSSPHHSGFFFFSLIPDVIFLPLTPDITFLSPIPGVFLPKKDEMKFDVLLNMFSRTVFFILFFSASLRSLITTTEVLKVVNTWKFSTKQHFISAVSRYSLNISGMF